MKNLRTRMLAVGLAVLCLMTLLSPRALADESTTTTGTVYKDLSSRTEIYVLTNSPGSSYPVYGAMYEPNGGVLYGRTAQGGTRPNGRYGLINLEEVSSESIISFYYSPTDAYSLEFWSYIYGPVLADGKHGLLVYLNFNNEGSDCSAVVAGSYDARLREMFTYMRTMDHPVFIRIGGEMNVWVNGAAPESFIAAYKHIADLARSIAPNVALVFSPNFSAAANVDMSDFYPGDQYVDWVGVSLYYNKYAANGDTTNDAFYGVGDIYGDPMLNVQQVINLAGQHSKPVMVTEGGAYNHNGSEDLSGWAAERLQKAFAFLPMVYPQIKCIISSDYTPGNVYTFYNNAVVTNAYRKAVKESGVYLEDYHNRGACLTPLSDQPDMAAVTTGDIVFTAYTYSPSKLTAVWTVDGQTVGTSSDYPYTVTLDRSILTGSHTIAVTFSNGQTKSYGINAGKAGAPKELPSSWAVEPVNRGISLGIVPASLQEKYGQATTRAEFCALAVGLYEAVSGTIDGRSTFTDTTDVNVEKMAYLGVVNGAGEGKFNPNGNLTREQAAAMLSRLANVLGKPLSGQAPAFADNASISPYAVEAVGQVQAVGIMGGVGNNTFAPGGSYTREQSIITIVRLYDLVK